MLQIQNKKLQLPIDIAICLLGTLLMSIGLHMFVAPNNVAPGGVTGISIVLNHLTGLSIGTASLLLNIPLLVVAFFKLGKIFFLKTAICTLAFTFYVDYLLVNLPVYTNEKFLAMVLAGICSGVGAGLVFARRGSTGGTDIIVLLIQKYNPSFKTGKITMALDITVVLTGALVFQNIEMVLYAVVNMVVGSFAIDKVIYGVDEGKMVMITSKSKMDDIKGLITEDLGRGATILQGVGGYTGEDSPVLMCAISKRDFVKVRQRVLDIDPKAFMIVLDTKEVLGEGFKVLEEHTN